jgi:hypothetical protein
VNSRISKLISENAGQSDVSSGESEGYEPGIHEKRARQKRDRQKRRQAIYGTGGGGALKGALRTMELFLFRLDKDTKTEDVQEYLHDQGLKVLKLECVSNGAARYKSYKLTIDFKDSEQVLDETFWPDGVGCRQFVGRRIIGGTLNRKNGEPGVA